MVNEVILSIYKVQTVLMFNGKAKKDIYVHEKRNQRLVKFQLYYQQDKSKYNSSTYSVIAAGFHEEGTSFFTFSERVILVLSNSTVYNVMNHPS